MVFSSSAGLRYSGEGLGSMPAARAELINARSRDERMADALVVDWFFMILVVFSLSRVARHVDVNLSGTGEQEVKSADPC